MNILVSTSNTTISSVAAHEGRLLLVRKRMKASYDLCSQSLADNSYEVWRTSEKELLFYV